MQGNSEQKNDVLFLLPVVASASAGVDSAWLCLAGEARRAAARHPFKHKPNKEDYAGDIGKGERCFRLYAGL